MSEFIKGLIIGLFAGDFLGCFIGVALMALLAMARDPEPPNREPEQNEPTILWTVGNLCMWKGKLCEIERFDTTANNQTVVHLRREGLDYGLCVPVEELEAVEK